MKKNGFLIPILAIAVILCTSVFACISPLSVQTAQAANTDNKLVVGYFPMAGYHEYSADGGRTGYGYEFLQQIARFSGWLYNYDECDVKNDDTDYVTFLHDYLGYGDDAIPDKDDNGSWNEALYLLDTGKIDILTSASYSDTRAARFDYSDLDYPLGYKSTILTTLGTNNTYVSGNASTFNGMRIATIGDSNLSNLLNEFLPENDFSYTLVYCSGIDEMRTKLLLGDVDAIVTSNLRHTANERVIAEFSRRPYFALFRKDSNLTAQFNEAIQQIYYRTPTYQSQLFQRFYGANTLSIVGLTEQEKQAVANVGTVNVLITPDSAPLSYFENGKPMGALVDIMNEVANRISLKINYLHVENYDQYTKALSTENLIVCGTALDYNWAEENGFRMTDGVFELNYCRLENRRGVGDGKIGVLNGLLNSEVYDYIAETYPVDKIAYYADASALVADLKKGNITSTYVNTYFADYAMLHDTKNQLQITKIGTILKKEIVLAVSSDLDIKAFSAISHSVNTLSADWVNETILEQPALVPPEGNFVTFFYNNILVLVIVLLGVIVLSCFLVLMIFRYKYTKKDLTHLQATLHYASMLFNMFDRVFELDRENSTLNICTLENGTIIKTFFRSLEYEKQYLRETLGVDEDELKSFFSQFNPQRIREMTELNLTESTKLRMRDLQGNYVWKSYYAHVVHHSNGEPSCMIYERDITDQKKKEEESTARLRDALTTAQSASSAKGNFMARMSHEIRTPMNAIIGYVALSQNEPNVPDKLRDYLEKADGAAKHLLSLINDVLDMSSIESGRLKIAHSPIDLMKFLNTVHSMFYNQTQQQHKNFILSTEGITVQDIMSDSLRLNQILMNLISNAIKFTPADGTIWLTVSQIKITDHNVYLRFQVKDTGKGMSENFRKRLFLPFEQENAETSIKFGGTGLGLSITSNLVNLLGGVISVESKEGVGSTFTVDMPFEIAPDESVDVSSLSSINTLVVDDELDTCEFMVLTLKNCGIESRYALTGQQAINMLRSSQSSDRPFNLLFIDMRMPQMDGVETIRRIREEFGDKLEIVPISAVNRSDVVSQVQGLNVKRILTKPLSTATVLSLMKDLGNLSIVKEEDSPVPEMFSEQHILLAEDNEMNTEIAVLLLESVGLTVDHAWDGLEVVKMFEESPKGYYTLVLMDIKMPNMNGYEATRAIRACSHPQARSIPIVAMTADAFAEDVALALSSGMNNHIAKPIDSDKLLRTIGKYIS